MCFRETPQLRLALPLTKSPSRGCCNKKRKNEKKKNWNRKLNTEHSIEPLESTPIPLPSPPLPAPSPPHLHVLLDEGCGGADAQLLARRHVHLQLHVERGVVGEEGEVRAALELPPLLLQGRRVGAFLAQRAGQPVQPHHLPAPHTRAGVAGVAGVGCVGCVECG